MSIYEIEHEIKKNWLAKNGKKDIHEKIKQILGEYNPFVKAIFINYHCTKMCESCKLIMKEQPSHMRWYNKPMLSQVATILIGSYEIG